MKQKQQTDRDSNNGCNRCHDTHSGFTLIELMIIIAVAAIILTLALPMYSDYLIRARIAESISASSAAQTAVTEACRKDRNITALDPSAVAYHFQPSRFVQKIDIGGACGEPAITVTTLDTGANPDPVLTITGTVQADSHFITWTCMSSGESHHLPDTCRS